MRKRVNEDRSKALSAWCKTTVQAPGKDSAESRPRRTESQLAQLRLTLTARVILEALLDRNTKHNCHFERSFKGRRILVLFDRNDCLPCDADLIGEFLLRHLPEGPEFSNLIAYCGHQSALRYVTICVAVFVISAMTNMPKKTLRK